MQPAELFSRFPQLYDAIAPHEPGQAQMADALVSLVQRHAKTVIETVSSQAERQVGGIVRSRLPADCLLRLALGPSSMLTHEQRKRLRERASQEEGRAVLAGEPRYLFRRQDEVWTLSVGDRVTRLQDRTGLRYIQYPLQRPNQDVSALDLYRAIHGAPAGDVLPMATGSAARRLEEEGLRSDGWETGIELADRETLKKLHERLQVLDRERATAEERNDATEEARLLQEKEQIFDYLQQVQGKGGRLRQRSTAAERARSAVSRVIRDALHDIKKPDPALHEFLERTISTGYSCAYRPDRDQSPDWRF